MQVKKGQVAGILPSYPENAVRHGLADLVVSESAPFSGVHDGNRNRKSRK